MSSPSAASSSFLLLSSSPASSQFASGKCQRKLQLQRPALLSCISLLLILCSATLLALLFISPSAASSSSVVNGTAGVHTHLAQQQVISIQGQQQQQQQQNQPEPMAMHPHHSAHSNSRFPFEEATPPAAAAADQGGEKNLFREYLSRGMFTCATKYVAILQQLNKLIANAHQEYSQCQGQMAGPQESRKLAAQLDMINELFSDE